MKNRIARIEHLIKERQISNNLIVKSVENVNSFTGDFNDHVDIIKDHERHLNIVMVNKFVIGLLLDLKADYHEDKLYAFLSILDDHASNWENISNAVTSQREILRKNDAYDKEAMKVINNSFTNADYNRQLYTQARYDLDSIIDFDD